jgi:hypothetical protein
MARENRVSGPKIQESVPATAEYVGDAEMATPTECGQIADKFAAKTLVSAMMNFQSIRCIARPATKVGGPQLAQSCLAVPPRGAGNVSCVAHCVRFFLTEHVGFIGSEAHYVNSALVRYNTILLPFRLSIMVNARFER